MTDEIIYELPETAAYQAQYEAAALRAEDERRSMMGELRKRLQQERDNPYLYLQLAKHHATLGEFRTVVAVLKEGLKRCPPTSILYLEAINTLEDGNETEDARNIARRAAKLCPDDEFLFRLKAALLLPVLYDTPEKVAFYHDQFAAAIREILAGLNLDTPMARRQALKGIGHHSNFYLTYQPGSLRALQEQYGELVHRIMAANYPQWVLPLKMPPVPPGGKIRIGYISSHFRQHSDLKCFLGWLSERNREEFEVFTFQIGRKVDVGTDEARRVSDHFCHIPRDLERTCEAVQRANLHVAVFINLLHPVTIRMAGLRLVPIQCAAWTEHWTSGLPTMDYYLSGELFEPEDGNDHYSESLVRLPGLGIYYEKPVIPRAILRMPRSHFGLREDRTVYLCGQSIFKYLPQHDDALVQIAKRNPSSQFCFPAVARAEKIQKSLSRRLQGAFAAEGLKSEDFCVQNTRALRIFDYWNLLLVSDVFLDTFNDSGFVTTMDAIACGIPVVTCRGDFSRGRQSYAILKQLGVTDTIAGDKEEYVDIAVRLGQDHEWRAQIVERMAARHGSLFGDTRGVRALEEFFRRVVKVG